jgi:hypothetical protein
MKASLDYLIQNSRNLTRPVVKQTIIIGVAVLSFTPNANAADYPYRGYFTFQTGLEKPEFMQAKCAYSFYKQNSDGTGTDYILDEKTYASSGKVQYLIYAENSCVFDPINQTDRCDQTVYTNNGSTKSNSRDVLKRLTDESFVNIFFNTELELKFYLQSQTKEIPSWIYPSAQQIFSKRCEGFDDTTLNGHLTSVQNKSTLDELSNILNRPYRKTDTPEILRIMEEISPEAANATLPGQ